MIQSLLIANRGEIACRIIRSPFLPGTGRGTARSVVEGAHIAVCAEAERWDPSVTPLARHLPVSGRNL
jgi:acetyl/propionyl-CoA carboxylase alpha subunit